MFVFKLFSNHWNFNKKPISKEEIYKNQKIRTDSFAEIIGEKSLDENAKNAVKKFWANQAYFFVDFLLRNKALLKKYFPEIELSSKKISKKTLLVILDQFLLALAEKDKRAKKIIGLLKQDCRLSLEPLAVASSSQASGDHLKLMADLSVVAKDSIQFAYEQSLQGKRVLIMDAANAQRPGAGAYERGTFQEALTRTTDLYNKILVDFRNVLADLVENDKASETIVEAELEKVDLFSYQCRFLSLIYYSLKKSLLDENYLVTDAFRKEFIDYADQIYGQMQNIVFEIPTGAGFVKNCRMVNWELASTQALFDSDDVFKGEWLSPVQARVLIVETAAPDTRWLHGQYDRGCTFNRDLQLSGDASKAEELIRGSIHYTLAQALEKNADIVLLNAFGCGAFGNDPKQVARIFAEVIFEHTEQLKGKSIFFMDLNEGMCEIFSKKFNDYFAGNEQWHFSPYGFNNMAPMSLTK